MKNIVNSLYFKSTFINYYIFKVFYFLNKLTLKKIKFINWFIIFIESQIISISIPYSNIVYRSYVLKKNLI